MLAVFLVVAFLAAVALCGALISARRASQRWKPPEKAHLSNTIDNALYFRKLNALDLIARGQPSVEAYLEAYKSSLSKFSSSESTELEELVAQADRACSPYAKLSAIEWTIAKFDGVEENFPHTLGDVIFLSGDFFSNARDKKVETLVHEKIHVYQRKHPIETSILVESLGFKPWKPQTKITNLRTNPDTNDFCYKLDGIAQAQTYNNNRPSSIKDSSTTVLEGASEGWALPESIHQRDHPYEITACAIADALLGRGDAFGGKIERWMQTYL